MKNDSTPPAGETLIENLGGRQYVRAEVGMPVFHAANYAVRGTVVAVHDGEVSVEYSGKSAGYEGPGVHRRRTFLLRTEAGPVAYCLRAGEFVAAAKASA